MLRTYTLTQLTAAGTVTTAAPVSGNLLAAYVKNTAGTVVLQTQNAPQMTLLTVAAGGTAWLHPRVQICDVGGTAISAQYTVWPVADYVQAAFNGSGTVDVTLLVDPLL